jgi:hypothetical protein
MTSSATFSMSLEAQQAAVLLEGYRFEMGYHDARQWVSLWLESYRPAWIRDAVIEALYQGRYKSISVRQILELWQRRGQPIRHATHDFEAAVCREFGEVKVAPTAPPAGTTASMAGSAGGLSANRSIRKKAFSANEGSLNGAQNGAQNGSRNGSAASSAAEPWVDGNESPVHKPVSFDLSALPPTPPGIAAAANVSLSAPPPAGDNFSASANSPDGSVAASNGAEPSKPSRKSLDNKAWRDFPNYTTPTYANTFTAKDSEDTLRAQRQLNGVLYASARAIQPFKPALPFSAETLRLARQKASSAMAQAN